MFTQYLWAGACRRGALGVATAIFLMNVFLYAALDTEEGLSRIFDAVCADMHVTFHPIWGRSSYVGLAGRHIMMTDAPGKYSHNLYRETLREVLSGYRFLPEVPRDVRNNPVIWAVGVCEFLCATQDFFSPRLRTCFDVIKQALQSQQSVVPVRKYQTWNVMQAHTIEQSVYPPGKTRVWSVIPLQKVHEPCLCEDRVCITFCGKPMALEGRLCEAPETEEERSCQQESLRSFRGTARKLNSAQVARLMLLPWQEHDSLQMWRTSVPRFVDLLDYFCVSPYNLGIVWFSQKGKMVAGIFDCSERMVDVVYRFPGWRLYVKIPFLKALKKEFMRGFVLKNAQRSAYKRSDILNYPRVREICCYRQKFSSEILRSGVLEYITQHWSEKGFRLQDKDGFWSALDRGHLQGLWSCSKGFEWTIIDVREARALIDGEQRAYSTIMIAVQGEAVALRGAYGERQCDTSPKETLWEYAMFNLLRQACTREGLNSKC